MDYYEPMKAKLSNIDFLEAVNDDITWGAGEKFDGYRELLYLFDDHNELISSGGNNHLPCVPQFSKVIPDLSGTVVDSEGLSPTRRIEDNGTCFKSSSYPESAREWQRQNGQATLVIFDILQYKGMDTTTLEFVKRRVLLRTVVTQLIEAGMPVHLEELVMVNKLQYYYDIISRSTAEGHEGIILKDMGAPYRPGKRGNAWLKVKRVEPRDYYITGFMDGTGKYTDMVGAVCYGSTPTEILGTSSGMDDIIRQDMTDHPDKYRGKLAHFACQEITDAGVMRHPRYLGMV